MITADSIYLDYAAATPMDNRVFLAMQPYFQESFYNPSALYRDAQHVRNAVTQARQDIAKVIGVQAHDIFFTAGATESINMAIHGVISHYGGSIVTTSIEHEAVLAAAQKFNCEILGVDNRGSIDFDALQSAVTDETTLISVGYVNNELGTVQRLKAVAAFVAETRERRHQQGNERPLFLHTDASQATGILDVSASRLGVDLMTLNAGKCYGPKQVGLLWRSSAITLMPLIVGGGQEFGLRSGTENVPGIVGFARALEMSIDTRKSESHRLEKIHQLFIRELEKTIPDIVFNGHPKRYSPHIVHCSVPGLDGERVVYALDQRGVMAATGSACAANRSTGSHVLKAISMDESSANGSLRFSFGRFTTEEEIKKAVPLIAAAVESERGL